MVLFQTKKQLGKIILSWTSLHSTTHEAESIQYALESDMSPNVSQWLTSAKKFVNKMAYFNLDSNNDKKKINLKACQADRTWIKNQSCRNACARRLIWISSAVVPGGLGWLFSQVRLTDQSGWELKWATVGGAGFPALRSPAALPSLRQSWRSMKNREQKE